MIAERHSTAEGSYVALTRRASTHTLYASRDQLDPAATSREQAITALAEQLGRSEPDLPSIRVPLAHEQRVEREHDRETWPSRSSEAERGPAQLADLEPLRGERDRLRTLISTYPAEIAAQVNEMEREAAWQRERGVEARERAERLAAQLDQMGRRERRSDHGRELQSYLEDAERRIDTARERELSSRAQIEQLEAQPDSPSRWEHEHPQAREHLKAAEQALDQALDRHADRSIQHPDEHITRVLGERPAAEREPERHAWEHGAHAVERYRIAHRLDLSEPSALGPQPDPSHTSWEQRSDWRSAGERVLEAREQLGIERSGRGPIEERLARVEGLMPEEDRERHLDRGHGWEL